MKQLPWSRSAYLKLEPGDLSPTPAPTPEQRTRVAATLVTVLRDHNMLGQVCLINAETIRAILVMDAHAWARDISDVEAELAKSPGGYDPMDPKVRFDQVHRSAIWPITELQKYGPR